MKSSKTIKPMEMKSKMVTCIALSAWVSATAMASPELIGRWRLTQDFASTIPEPCRDAYLDVSDAEITTVSGSQVVTVKYQSSKKHNDFVILISDVRVEGGQNCQGFEPEFVKEHFATFQIWRQENGKIRVLAPTLLMEIERLQ